MIVITGAVGFIGSYLLSYFNELGEDQIILVDDFSFPEKNKNIAGKKYVKKIERNAFIPWFEKNYDEVDFVFHIGARTDTTEFDHTILEELNVSYSKSIWNICADKMIGLVYASSAATYGLGELGYADKHELIEQLKPLNPYGVSKNEFDKWALAQKNQPPFWCGLKFFNIYGPNEFHKGRMASVIFHAYKQIKETGAMNLFQSHNPDFKDGEQKRDFVYVYDLAKVCDWMAENQPKSGIYNLGSGKARTFLDLVNATFHAMNKEPKINFIPTPEDIRDKYQYFTEADMSKLQKAGYTEDFFTLEEGVEDYVQNYLIPNKYF
ncbi:MAG: ADP-glyceromanno-heptose 6-epimerase [Bacteroidetes bacterium]|nr:MAG: ADP-glyceromanno-heptose 6-epimerase [Bacteroidota bacterium]MBL1144915.1 ADP-glyceromanno-heptose 6-epimerase [Bacteroidota bacterium]MCB0803415.1 ADP-glyceromanno-heptose 6-epimerase [Flavobacteriales bacterium]NOG57709.1 ADP-glyceromanno-heptose 6-epimerase [Bacteroidota bacterium]